MEATTELLDDLQQVVHVLLDDPARFLRTRRFSVGWLFCGRLVILPRHARKARFGRPELIGKNRQL